MAIRCVHCNTENRVGAKFCHQCGQRLPPAITAAEPAPVDQAAEALADAGDAAAPIEMSSPDAGPTLLVVGAEMPDASVDEILRGAQNDNRTDGQPAPITLAVGSIVLDRFHVIRADAPEEGAVEGVVEFLVEDRGVCRSCGTPVQPTDEEPYCFECGANLLDTTLAWPQRRLRPVSASGAAEGECIEWEGGTYEIIPVVETSRTEGQASVAPFFQQGVQLLVGLRSDVGLARMGRPDEDSLFALTLTGVYESAAQPTTGLYIVADGMGGHGEGEIASRLAVDAIGMTLVQSAILPVWQGNKLPEETIRALVDAAIQAANRRVFDNAQARKSSMGTTLTLALIFDSQVYVANVGDSRTYLWRGGLLRQLTEDHSGVYRLFRQGLLSEEELYTHPRRNEIDRCLGCDATVRVDQFAEKLLPGDALLLCCDGLWEMLHNDGIADVLLSAYGDPQAICDELVKRANLAGGDDNISVIVVRAVA